MLIIILGRTHMAIGAVGAIIATPLILHSHWDPIGQLMTSNGNTISHVLIAQAGLVIASVVGSLLVDLDERHSLAAQKVELLASVPLLIILSLFILLSHLQTSVIAWIVALIVTFSFHTHQNWRRKIGLGVLGAGLLYAGFAHIIPLVGDLLLTVWIVGAIFTGHRTFTHSLVGVIIFAVGSMLSMQGNVLKWLEHHELIMLVTAVPYGLVVGYVLHLLADVPTGGVSLFWPFHKRIGLRLFATGGVLDTLIGVVALVGFVVLAVI